MDPFLDVIRLLRPRATLWRRIEGTGRWGVSFRKRNDLLFCSVAAGECQLMRPGVTPLQLMTGDLVLVRTSTPFSLASDPTVAPEDSERAFAAAAGPTLTLGTGEDRPVTLLGGRFLFDTANENLLTALLPQVLHVSAADPSAWRVQSLLKMNAAESLHPQPGSEFMVTRLMELILVDALRNHSNPSNHSNHSLGIESRAPGMLAGLANPVTAAALRAMHGKVAHNWTVAELARLAGVSRSTFAARFREVVGVGPIEYLLNWRMALAKDELRRGTRSVSEIAFAVGFQSVSAFSTAFRRAVGCPPGRFCKAVA